MNKLFLNKRGIGLYIGAKLVYTEYLRVPLATNCFGMNQMKLGFGSRNSKSKFFESSKVCFGLLHCAGQELD